MREYLAYIINGILEWLRECEVKLTKKEDDLTNDINKLSK